MAFFGKDTVRTEIVVDDMVLDKLSHFSYPGCHIPYAYDKDVEAKTNRFGHICSSTSRNLKHKTRKDSPIKFHKAVTVSTLLCVGESMGTN